MARAQTQRIGTTLGGPTLNVKKYIAEYVACIPRQELLGTRPSETEAVTSGNGVLKLHLSQRFLSKFRWPQICETAKRS